MPDPLSPSAAPADDLTGRQLSGRYRLNRLIATGGMAQVWEAEDEVLSRPVAVKLLHRHLAADESFVERFRAEAIAAARLAHPAIVSIFDTCHDLDSEAIVMELVRGRTLRQYLDERRHLDARATVLLGTQVADALEVAHRAGLVHRDIKPANILLSDDGRVLVADFGIAKATEGGDLTKEGLMVGTAKYLAPEQVEGKPVDPRTDIYSLGIVLYEAITGRPPFQESTDAATALARLRGAPLRPRQVRAGIPKGLEQVILKAMALRPEDRYASAAELRTALRAARLDNVDPSGATDAPVLEDLTRSEFVPVPIDPAADPTPVPDKAPSFAQSERGWLVPTLVIVVVMLGLGIAGVLFGQTSPGRKLIDQVTGTKAAPAPLKVSVAHSFDPLGNNHVENEDLAHLAVDGNASTVWQTEQYQDPLESLHKSGVGIYVTLDKAANLQQLLVSSPSSGWSATIYVADGPVGSDLASWGQPVAQRSGIQAGNTLFQLKARRGTSVLIWITHLATEDNVHEVRISEISPKG